MVTKAQKENKDMKAALKKIYEIANSYRVSPIFSPETLVSKLNDIAKLSETHNG
jgi:hypothetical protein